METGVGFITLARSSVTIRAGSDVGARRHACNTETKSTSDFPSPSPSPRARARPVRHPDRGWRAGRDDRCRAGLAARASPARSSARRWPASSPRSPARSTPRRCGARATRSAPSGPASANGTPTRVEVVTEDAARAEADAAAAPLEVAPSRSCAPSHAVWRSGASGSASWSARWRPSPWPQVSSPGWSWCRDRRCPADPAPPFERVREPRTRAPRRGRAGAERVAVGGVERDPGPVDRGILGAERHAVERADARGVRPAVRLVVAVGHREQPDRSCRAERRGNPRDRRPLEKHVGGPASVVSAGPRHDPQDEGSGGDLVAASGRDAIVDRVSGIGLHRRV